MCADHGELWRRRTRRGREHSHIHTNSPARLTLQKVRSGTFLIVDIFIISDWVQYMHLAVKYSVLRTGLPALIHGHYTTHKGGYG